MELNKATVINNIYTLAKNKGLKLGELEAAVGISTGYLAKIKSDENRSVPGVEILANIAQQLGVTLDMLISADIESLNADEKFILQFIDDLLKKTDKNKLYWERLTPRKLNGFHQTDDFYAPDYPLFTFYGSTEYGPEVEYNSMFYKDTQVNCEGNSYRSQVADETFIYLMSVNVYNCEKEQCEDELELYLNKGDEIHPLCCKFITPTFSPFKDILEKLYAVLENKTGHQTISFTAVEEMADIMGVEIPDDLALPF